MRACTSQEVQVWVPNHVAPIVLHARWDRRKKGRGERGAPSCRRPCPEWVGKKRKKIGCVGLLWKQTTPAYTAGLQYTHTLTHAHTHLPTHPHMRKPQPARPRDTSHQGQGLYRCRANKPETSINPVPGLVGSAASPVAHLASVPVDTILSQSPGLWENLPQLIGFAGRLGFWPHGGEREGAG